MQEEWKYIAVALLVVCSFLPITLESIKKRRLSPPPLAKRDRKLYRLWQSDPGAYERQYGALDKEYLAKQQAKRNNQQ